MKSRCKWYILLAILAMSVSGCGNDPKTDEVAKQTQEDVTQDKVTQEDDLKEELSTEEKTTQEPVEEEIDTEEIEETEPVVLEDLSVQIQELIQAEQDNGTVVSVYVEKLETGDYVSLSQGRQRSASLIKLYVAGCVYEQMDTLRASQAYEGEIEELVKAMITVSDNDATNTLVNKLGQGDAAMGMAQVNAYCQAHGFTETYMGRLMLDFSSSEDNYTSVTDCSRFLKAVYYNEIVGAEKILDYMKQQERIGKLPAGVPEGVVTANKTGELDDVENDVAIVYGNECTYIISVMMSGLPDASQGRSTIVELSSRVYKSLQE